MKIKIHDGSPHEPDCVYLRLVQADPNHIVVGVVDDSGEMILDNARFEYGSALLTITEKGQVALSPAVFPEMGFDLDHDGRIKLDPFCEGMAAKHGRFDGKRAVRIK